MQLPDTPIPVVFKSTRKMDPDLKTKVNTVPGSTRMYQLPANTLVIWGDKQNKTYRLVGPSSYDYAAIDEHPSGYYLSGSIRGNYGLNELIDSINILKPFLKYLYRS